MTTSEIMKELARWIATQNTDVTGHVPEENWTVLHVSNLSVVIARGSDSKAFRFTVEEFDAPDPEKAA